jgi:hypothetical protein
MNDTQLSDYVPGITLESVEQDNTKIHLIETHDSYITIIERPDTDETQFTGLIYDNEEDARKSFRGARDASKPSLLTRILNLIWIAIAINASNHTTI